jgi:N-acyl-D-aspartate/D-glutamate deacylase
MPSFRGDVAVRAGKIVELGKLSGAATRVVDADGLVVAPGFVDNHCHYDAQVTWDPLCSFSCYHGAMTVIIGNCSLALAPLHPGRQERPWRVSLGSQRRKGNARVLSTLQLDAYEALLLGR